MDSLAFLTVELMIEEEASLMILLHSDGTINRKGNGSMNIDKNFFMGLIETTPILKELTPFALQLEPYLNHTYDIPEKNGKHCYIQIVLSDGKETKGLKVAYGSESAGPPPEAADFVGKVIELTNPWYYAQQKNIRKKQKSWWQFWK